MNHTCLCFASWSWYSFPDPGGMEGWVGPGGWLHTKINVRHWELNPDTVSHLSTNWTRRSNSSIVCQLLCFIVFCSSCEHDCLSVEARPLVNACLLLWPWPWPSYFSIWTRSEDLASTRFGDCAFAAAEPRLEQSASRCPSDRLHSRNFLPEVEDVFVWSRRQHLVTVVFRRCV